MHPIRRMKQYYNATISLRLNTGFHQASRSPFSRDNCYQLQSFEGKFGYSIGRGIDFSHIISRLRILLCENVGANT
ncbi:unnamed protein product [Brugia timori]|uniref:Ovule protein n=1 Tax=Brugia timori TaxID=42155 RepID=A0A0R3QE90_9BILA|nr:unnamed protein product [Brugia timori]